MIAWRIWILRWLKYQLITWTCNYNKTVRVQHALPRSRSPGLNQLETTTSGTAMPLQARRDARSGTKVCIEISCRGGMVDDSDSCCRVRCL